MWFFKKERHVRTNLTIEELSAALRQPVLTIAAIPLNQTAIFLEDIKPTREHVQLIYREIKAQNFEGTFADFLCWISTQLVVRKAKTASVSVHEIPAILAALVSSDPENATNTLRLFHAEERYLLDALEISDPADRKEIFLAISDLWYEAKRNEYTQEIAETA